MSTELLRLCDYPVRDESVKSLSMSGDVPTLSKLTPSLLIIPLQESMTVSLPATSSSQSTHQAFPPNAPTIAGTIFPVIFESRVANWHFSVL